MKKFILISPTFVALAVTGLLAEDAPATVSLPTAPTPAANPAPTGGDSNASHSAQGDGHSGHKGHKKHHHHHKGGSSQAPAPKS